jgi:competence protein ComEC
MAEVAVAGEGIGASAPPRLRPIAAFVAALAAEDDRRALWLPVFFGTGIALYFTLPSEPPVWAGLAATVPLALAVVALRRYPG